MNSILILFIVLLQWVPGDPYFRKGDTLRISLDGSDPTRNSQIYNGEKLNLTKTTLIKARVFNASRWSTPTDAESVLVTVSTTSVEEDVPESFYLWQTYPNPFNTTTKLKYKVGNTGLVQLIVYDINGREIQVLVNENQIPGTYTKTFDAGNLSSGIYFLLVKQGDNQKVRKLLLIR